MRADNFLEDHDDVTYGLAVSKQRFRTELAQELRRGPLEDESDVEAAVALARLVHDELEVCGTDGSLTLNEADMRLAIQALRAVTGRLGLTLEIPFRDYATFRNYWIREGARGSWQARRDLLEDIFGDLHDQLADMESKNLTSTLAQPVSPRGRTGWTRIDEELAELRRHFEQARTAQDYRNVGNDCVIITEALSAQLYDPDQHLREGEEEPPVAKTKQRLDRFVDDALPGRSNAELRKLVKVVIEATQATKHDPSSTRRDAGLAADSVIMLANLLRRLDEPAS